MVYKILIYAALVLGFSTDLKAETKQPIKIGFIGSLSDFAASYGTAVLEGAQLALDEVKREGINVELLFEDDRSQTRNSVTAYQKLKTVDKVDAIIGGSWWINAIVKLAEQDNIPLISCETLYNEDFINGRTYFTLGGDLRDWVRAYEPLIKERGWKSGAILKFVSGFAETLLKEFSLLFRQDGRKFLQAFEYQDIELSGAETFALKIKNLSPEVLYFDGQPASFANFIRRLTALHTKDLNILTHSVAGDAFKQKLFDPFSYRGRIYFTNRETHKEPFLGAFRAKYKRDPVLEADLGYYALKLLVQGLSSKDAIRYLKAGEGKVNGINFTFDDNNVYRGIGLEVFTFSDDGIKKVTPIN